MTVETFQDSGDFGPPLPPGMYRVRFNGRELTESIHGQCWLWKFEVVDGEHAEKYINQVTPNKLTIKNKMGRFVAAMMGLAAPQAGMQCDPESWHGQEYMATVVPGKNPEFSDIAHIAPAPPKGGATTQMQPPQAPPQAPDQQSDFPGSPF